jgi:AraC-like DNA-binding protein
MWCLFHHLPILSGQRRDHEGKEYIDNHWKEEFDIDKLAEYVHMSRYHYTRLFKEHTG